MRTANIPDESSKPNHVTPKDADKALQQNADEMAAKAGETEREFGDKHGIFEKSSRQRLSTSNSGSHIMNKREFLQRCG